MEEYLKATKVIDWQHPKIIANIKVRSHLAGFEWVPDKIYHMNRVTCRVLKEL
jgi:hypothetical protein